jgi:hypothetical protein
MLSELWRTRQPSCFNMPDRADRPEPSLAGRRQASVAGRGTSGAPRMANLSFPVIIEFVGPPGSGKSTIARQTAIILRSRGLSCACRPPLFRDRIGKGRHRVGVMLHRIRHAPLHLRGLRFSLSVRPLRFSRARAARHLVFLDYYLKAIRSREYHVLLMDQAFIQTLWSTLIYGKNSDAVAMNRLIGALYADYAGSFVFVRINVDARTAAARSRERALGWSRFDHMPVSVATSLIEAHEGQFDPAVAEAARASRAGILTLDGRRPLSCNVLELADFIERRIRPAVTHLRPGARPNRDSATGELPAIEASGSGLSTPAPSHGPPCASARSDAGKDRR